MNICSRRPGYVGRTVCRRSGTWYVPSRFPGLLAATLFAFVTSVNEFTLTLLTYGPTTVTLTIQTYIEIDKGFREIASAISVILLAPSLLLLIAIQKIHKAREDHRWTEGPVMPRHGRSRMHEG